MKSEFTLTRADFDSPRDQLCDDLRLPTSAADDTLIAEVIRAVLHASTIAEPVVAHELMIDRVMEILAVSVDRNLASVRENVTEMAELLASMGDLTRLYDGSWRPGPTIVVTHERNDRLLVSGQPSRAFAADGALVMEQIGALRYLRGEAEAVSPVSAVDWIGRPTEDIATWTTAVLSSEGLEPSTPELLHSADYTFYRTGRLSEHMNHWAPTDIGLKGRFLTRVFRYPDLDRYAIAELDDGHLIAQRFIHHDAARRLTFGIDAMHNRSIRATARPVGDLVNVTVERAVPHREARLLTALCGRASNRYWTVAKKDASAVEQALEQIGVCIGH